MTDSHRELKGLIFSGGKNSRLRPFLHTGAEQLAPLANKPSLFYALEATRVDQPAPLGIAQAVKTSEGFLGSGPLVLHLGDNFRLPVATGLSGATSARCTCPDASTRLSSLGWPALSPAIPAQMMTGPG